MQIINGGMGNAFTGVFLPSPTGVHHYLVPIVTTQLLIAAQCTYLCTYLQSSYVPYQRIFVESERKDMLLLLDFLWLASLLRWTVSPYAAGSNPDHNSPSVTNLATRETS